MSELDQALPNPGATADTSADPRADVTAEAQPEQAPAELGAEPRHAAPSWLATTRPARPWWVRMWTARPGARPLLTPTLIFGETLIALGVLVSLYLTWELFWTDIPANAKQAATVQSLPWAHTGVPGQAPTMAPALPPDSTATDAHVAAKTTIAVIRIPRFGDAYLRPISEGVDKHTVLDALGIGHFPGTAAPGGVGNFATIGHRTTYGKPYAQIADLQTGDLIFVDTPQGRFEYRVYEHLVVLPTQVDVTGPQAGHPRVMTLIACTPKGSASHRYVVHADLVSFTPIGTIQHVDGPTPTPTVTPTLGPVPTDAPLPPMATPTFPMPAVSVLPNPSPTATSGEH